MMDKKIYVTCSTMPPYEEYIEMIRPLWDTHMLTNMGTYHNELENQLREYLGVHQFVLTVNGHMALEIALQAFDFPAGSEVITTPFTFISTTHAIIRNRLTPVFCDIKSADGTIDECKIEELITEKTVAIMPVHVYGNVCNVEEIQRIADRYGLKVIYDAAHTFGVKYRDIGIGNYGDVSIFSFHATKAFNTLGGGGISCSDCQFIEKVHNLRNFGIRGEELVVDIGMNAKMNEFAAVMGLCNLKHYESVLAERREKYEYYTGRLREVEGVRLLEGSREASRNYGYLPIVLEEGYGKTRDGLYDYLKENDIYSRKYFYPLTSDQECFKGSYRHVHLKCARELAESVLVLPFSAVIKKADMDLVVDLVEQFVAE